MRRKQVVPPGSSPMVRLMARCEKTADGCWLWTGDIADPTLGHIYGRIKHMGRCVRTHRLAYEIEHGPIPSGQVLDHLCRNTLCFNPAHLEAVPQRVNVMRGDGICATNAFKVACNNGHPFTPENTYEYVRNGSNRRQCRTCGRDAMRRRRARH